MKLEILQENFNYGLNLVSRVLSAKPQLPILSHILLSADNGHLTLTASNQETTIVTQIGAKVTAPGQFTLPGRTLTEIVASLSSEKVFLGMEGTVMTVKTSGFSAKLNGTPASEYPSLIPQSEPGGVFWEVAANVFQRLISKTIFSAASDESRAVLTGVLFQVKENQLVLASTDGFRLSVAKLDHAGKIAKGTKQDLVIPAKTLLEVSRVLSDTKTDKSDSDQPSKMKITVFEESNQILFDLGTVRIYSRLVAGNFPDFEKIIPATTTVNFLLSAEELSHTVHLASIFARESANIVKLHIAHSKLYISANAPEVGENESEMDIKIDGAKDEFTIAFNFHYLLDFLAAIETAGDITIGLTGPTAPGVFRSDSDPDFLHLIMPVRVQS